MTAAQKSTGASVVTTTILLSNLHCPSCVKTVEDTLQPYQHELHTVSTSLVSQHVTITHNPTLPAAQLAAALYDVGFDVQSMWEQRGHQKISAHIPSSSTNAPDTSKRVSSALLNFSCGLLQSPDERSRHDAMHSANCEQCAADRSIQRQDSRAYLTDPPESYEAFGDDRRESHISVIATAPITAPKYRMVMVIEGMTCSACVGRVAEVLEAKSYVLDVQVNLLGHSATLHIIDKDKSSELVEEVEDVGYDAALESCELVPTADGEQSVQCSETSETRTVTIEVAGIHCPHCPDKIMQALQHLHPQVSVVDAPTMDGHVTVAYTPQPPDMTIRSILRQIQSADPAFVATVFRPQTLEERAQKIQLRQRRTLTLRLAIAISAAIPTFVFGVVFMSLLPQQNHLQSYWQSPSLGQTPRLQWPLLAFSTIVYFFAADLFHRRAVKEMYMMWRPGSRIPLLRRFYRFGSMDMLLSLGTTVAYLGSIVIVIMSSVQADSTSTITDTTTYFDAVVFLTMFLLAGRLLEAYGKAQTADAVASLSKLRAKEALLCVPAAKSEEFDGVTANVVPVDQLEAGDVVLVPAGGSPPCDGITIHGTTTFNEASLTGESRAVTKTIDDEVFAGTINIANAIRIRVTGSAGVSLLDRIIDTVREGQAKRAPIERIADVLTGYFVPIIVLIALLDWLIWMLLGFAGLIANDEIGTGGVVFWSLQFAIAVLVVACPCGIGLAAPTALFVGTGLAAKQGILVKGGGEAFQEASTLDCVVFDKTGTITQGGNLSITDSRFLSETDKHNLLGGVLALESGSSHPLARAVLSFCEHEEASRNIVLQESRELAGKGMYGELSIAGSPVQIVIGNKTLAEEFGIILSQEAQRLFERWSSQGKTVMLVGSKLSGQSCFSLDVMLAASDPIRPEAASVVDKLQSTGIEVWLLSGDNKITANVVAAQVGIAADHVIAGVMPQEKAEKIRYLQRRSRKTSRSRFGISKAYPQRASVAMVGDGINDAPALAAADVGIAMGSGSDTAISTASFVLLKSDLESVLSLLSLSRAVLRRVKFNFAWAIGYNLIMLPIAAGVLFPIVNSNGSHVRLDPVWASLAMALSSVSVITSSLLLKTRLPLVGFRATNRDRDTTTADE